MPRPLVVVLLAAGVVAAGVGAVLSATPVGAGSFGWTAYAPLSGTAYAPATIGWPPRTAWLGLSLLALGAGTAGAAVAALVARRR